jgi:hypothetical protein
VRQKIILDSGGVSALARRAPDTASLWRTILNEESWKPVVPVAVLVECLTGDPGRDAAVNRALKDCKILEKLPRRQARRAADLRTRAGRGSAVDAIVVATAEPDGVVLTSDPNDVRALASHAYGVTVRGV